MKPVDRPMVEVEIRPVWRFRATGERDFDFMLLALLEAVEENGKLTLAAARAGISYRHAWNLIEKWAHLFGEPLVDMERGRGTRLTPLGQRLLWAGKRVQARLEPELDSLAAELAAALNESLGASSVVLRAHASHDLIVARLRGMLAEARVRLDLQYRGSFDALGSLRRGDCDLAGFHVAEGRFGERMGTQYAEWLGADEHRLIRLFTRTQGFIVAQGNPKDIRSVADLVRPGIKLINRQRGSGTRALLEYLIADAGVDRARIAGYEDEEFTHAAVAALVASGNVDAGFGIEGAAAEFRLGFVPVVSERYFLACRQASLGSPAIQALLKLLRGRAFGELAASIPGYDATGAGEVLTVAIGLGRRA